MRPITKDEGVKQSGSQLLTGQLDCQILPFIFPVCLLIPLRMCEQGALLVTPWTICEFFQSDHGPVKDGDDQNLDILNFIRWYDDGEWISSSVSRLGCEDFHKVEICIDKQKVKRASCTCSNEFKCLHVAAMLLYVLNKKLVQESDRVTALAEGVFYYADKEVVDHKYETDHIYLGRLGSGIAHKPAVIAIFLDTSELQHKIKMLLELNKIFDCGEGILNFPEVVGPVELNYSESGVFIAVKKSENISLAKYIDLCKSDSRGKRDSSGFVGQLVSIMDFIHTQGCYLKNFNPDNICVSLEELRIEIDAFSSVGKCKSNQELAQAQRDNVFALGGLILFIMSNGNLKFNFSDLEQNKDFTWNPSVYKNHVLRKWLQPVAQMLDNERPRLCDIPIPKAKKTESDPGYGSCDDRRDASSARRNTTNRNEDERPAKRRRESVTAVVDQREEQDVMMQKDTHFDTSTLPETSLFIELPPSATYKGLFRYCAISMSSGREISKYDENVTTVLEGIQPADKYEVCVYEVNEKSERLIAKSIKQTKKFVGKEGGIVEVGCCVLDFPEGAIKDEAFIEIDRSHKNLPRLPENRISIAPVMDFRSTQRVFLKPVSCKITTPYITSPTPIEVEIMCYENGKWDHVCYGELGSESKVIEFKCDHFSPYADIIPKSFDEICGLNMEFDIRNRIYVNEEYNLVCVTYLDDDSILGKLEPELKAYRQSSFMLEKSCLRIGEHLDFALKSLEPERELRSWRATLNKKFIRNDWRHTKVLALKRENFEKPDVTLQLTIRHSDSSEPDTEEANVDFGRTVRGPVSALIVSQGGSPTVNVNGSTSASSGS